MHALALRVRLSGLITASDPVIDTSAPAVSRVQPPPKVLTLTTKSSPRATVSGAVIAAVSR